MVQDEKGGNPAPTVDNNWKITGVNLDSPLKEVVFDKVRIGELMIPTSEDGRTLNVKLLNVYELIDEGMLKVSTYTVEPGDNLWAIAKKIRHELERIKGIQLPGKYKNGSSGTRNSTSYALNLLRIFDDCSSKKLFKKVI